MPVPSTLWLPAICVLCAVACAGPAGDAGGPRFVVVSDLVVRDTRTALEWTRRDDGSGLDWHRADAYCRSLVTDGGGDWRLPGIEELHGLYGGPARHPCGEGTCAIDPAFTLTSPWVWSATAPFPTSRTYLDFQSGSRLSPAITPQLRRRVLCVRPTVADRRR